MRNLFRAFAIFGLLAAPSAAWATCANPLTVTIIPGTTNTNQAFGTGQDANSACESGMIPYWGATPAPVSLANGLPSLNVPSSVSGAGIAPIVSAAIESSHVLKASAGNLYSVKVTSGATSGCLMVFNATAAPANGAVTPAEAPAVVSANSTVAEQFNIPEYFSTGITAVFSSTCGLTLTASATALFSAEVQ